MPAFAVAVEIGVQQVSRTFFAQAEVFDECREIEKRIVVAGIFPVEEAQGRNADDIFGDQVVVTAAGPCRLPGIRRDIHAHRDEAVISIDVLRIDRRGSGRIE